MSGPGHVRVSGCAGKVLTSSRATSSVHASPPASAAAESDKPRSPVVFVVGAGDATGGAVARRFAREGYTACVSRRPRHADKLTELVADIRSRGHAAESFPMDARLEEDICSVVEKIEDGVGPIEVAVFNIGANVKFDVTDTTARVFRKVKTENRLL